MSGQQKRIVRASERDAVLTGEYLEGDDRALEQLTPAEMTSELAALREEVDYLREQSTRRRGHRGGRLPRVAKDLSPEGVSRRHLFGLLGGAAATGAGLAVAGTVLNATPAFAVGLTFNFVPPARIFDTRPGQAPLGCAKGQISSTQPVATPGQVFFGVNGQGSVIPVLSGVTAGVVGNITITGMAGPVFLFVTKSGTGSAPPTNSTINAASAGITIANGFTSLINTTLGIDALEVDLGGAATDFIVDIFGYYS